jgi:pimeloyl-ACP methyl ester carboxylesterase
METNIQPFKVHLSQAVLNDLRDRLARTRWPDEVHGSGWDYGSNLDYMKKLGEYWRMEFDWGAQEKAINKFSHFRANLNGLGIHFIRERGKGSNPLPIIITHGWPSSFYQMLKIIPLLADPEGHGGDPADSFDVIVPSMPGYGFSDRPEKRGITVTHIADLWARLMKEELGYRRFVAQGGDIGSGVTARLALSYPELLLGIHVTDVRNPYLGEGARELSEAERKFLAEEEKWEKEEGAYSSIQATKPQTLAYGLNESPIGLAAWIVEKFRSWSDCDGDVERRFTKDELLTNLTIYWATETINSSIRLYYEHRHNPSPPKHVELIQVPTAVALFPKDLSRPPREWAERTCNVHRWTEMPRGGHFAAMEEPELLVEDIRAFFRTFR